jgi:hypothetical protein
MNLHKANAIATGGSQAFITKTAIGGFYALPTMGDPKKPPQALICCKLQEQG